MWAIRPRASASSSSVSRSTYHDPPEGVGRLRDAELVLEHLLRAHGQRLGVLGRDRDRLVEARERHRLHTAERRGERLDRRPHDVVLGLLERERRSSRLRVGSQHHRPRIRRAEPVAHHVRPEPAERPVLRDLLEEVHVGVEDPREPRRELVDADSAVDHSGDVGDRVCDREAHLLRGGAARLAHVVPGERDRVEARRGRRRPRDQVGGQPKGRPRRVDVGAAAHVLLEDVVLGRPPDLRGVTPLAPAGDVVHRDQHRRRRVDGHRRRDLVERDAVEQGLHVADGVDRHAHAPDLALRTGVVGVEAHLGREVKRRREAGLALVDQEPEPAVGLGGGAVAGVLSDRPRPAGVHVAVDPARERERPGVAEIAVVVERGVARAGERPVIHRGDPRPRARLRPGRPSSRRARSPSSSGAGPGTPTTGTRARAPARSCPPR